MRIGIDARFLTHPQSGGFKTYSQNLVEAFGRVGRDHRYVLYVDRRRPYDPLGTMRVPNWAETVVVPTRMPVVGMALREQIGLPIRSAHDHLNVLHALCNTAPLVAPAPVVLTLHDTIQIVEPQRFQHARGRARLKQQAIASYSRAVIRRTVRTARRVITVSQYEKGRIVADLGADPDRVRVVHLAPGAAFWRASDPTRAAWRNEEGLRLPERFVLGVGYEPRKNIPLLIDAFAADCAPRDSTLGLVIVAAEPTSAEAFACLAANRGISHRTVVLGGQSAEEMARLYNLAEVFAFPSVRESFGLPPLEALACGTPVVAACASSLPEVMGDAAVLVEPCSRNALGQAMVAVLIDSGRRREMEARGLARARKFSWERTATETLAVYEEAVG